MLADMAMQLEAALALIYLAAKRSERGDPDLAYFSAACKCVTSDVAMTVTTDAVPLLGGYGYTQDPPSRGVARREGDHEGIDQVQHIVLARKLLRSDSR